MLTDGGTSDSYSSSTSNGETSESRAFLAFAIQDGSIISKSCSKG